MSALPRSRRAAALLAAACVALLGGYAVSQASLPATASTASTVSGGFGGFGGGPPGAAQLGPPPSAP
jgi:hypothetical protein